MISFYITNDILLEIQTRSNLTSIKMQLYKIMTHSGICFDPHGVFIRHIQNILRSIHIISGDLDCAVVKVLCYKYRKVAGSIPAGVIEIFRWHKPSDRTMVLGSTQPLTEISTRSISWGVKAPVRKADNLPPSCAVAMKSGNLNFLRTLWACPGL